MKIKIVLGCILLCAFLLRIIHLESIPRGLHADEASFMINTVGLMETGKDEDGRHFPLFLESIIDSKPALYSYLQIPFLAVFGATTFASRLPSVVLGVISVYLAYFFIWKLTRNQFLSLSMAGVLSFSPWHIMNSRATQEVIMSLVFVQLTLLAGVPILKNWIENKKNSWKNLPVKNILLFSVCALLAMYSYHAAKLFLLLFVSGIMAWLFLQRPSWQRFNKGFIIIILLAVTLGMTVAAASTRFNSIGLTSSDLPKARIFEFTSKATPVTPLFLLRIFYNKPLFYGSLFVEQYFEHFSLNYLFLQGGATGRFSIPSQGLFYLVEALLMFAGLYYFLTSEKYSRYFPYWLIFILSAPVASALTTEELPSSIRAFYMVLPLSFLIALGFVWLTQIKTTFIKSGIIFIIFAMYSWGFAYFIEQFFVQMPLWRPWNRSRHYEIAAQRIASIENQYDSVIMTNDLREMYIYLWLNKKITIQDIQNQPKARYKDEYQIGKYVFNKKHCEPTKANPPSLLVTTIGCDTANIEGYTPVEEIEFDDGVPALRLMVQHNPEMSKTVTK